MRCLADELAQYDGDLRRMFQTARKLLSSAAPLAAKISRRQLVGGKRLRAVIALLSGRLCGLADRTSDQTAVAIELIHSATLLHDDVVDDASMRRRRKTANELHGNAAAVLAGDFLYSRASQILAGLECQPLLLWIADATNSLAEGEILQLERRGGTDMTREMYFDIINRKTANLFEAASAAGALLAEKQDILPHLAAYGRHLGTAFQLIDDCLDYDGSDRETGKKIGADFAEGKMTLPAILALEKTSAASRRRILAGWQRGDEQAFADTLRLTHETGALAEVRHLAVQEVEQAMAALQNFPPHAKRDSLINLARASVMRRG